LLLEGRGKKIGEEMLLVGFISEAGITAVVYVA